MVPSMLVPSMGMAATLVGRRALCLLGTLLAVCLNTSAADAVDVVSTRWGFDGKVVVHRFVPLSILVNNPRPEAFDGELVLLRLGNQIEVVDAAVSEAVYVGPFGERWVQFYPYIANPGESFRLEVRVKNRVLTETVIPGARQGWPARVLIEPASRQTRAATPIKRLPDVLFPPFVTATDGLQAVLLDAVPNWDEPRRQAFLDWLSLGGTAFVLQAAGGEFPRFPTNLAMLNGPLDQERYFAGRVIRVAKTRGDLTAEAAEEIFKALPPRMVSDTEGNLKELSPLDDDETDKAGAVANFGDPGDPLSVGSFFSKLKALTKPEHNWPLLHLLFWLYLGLVFPGCYLLGKRTSDYRIVYVALLAIVAVFSVLFGVVGRRGYGEATTVNSVAIVRELPNGFASIAQWSNAFVTSGGTYRLTHDGQGTLFDIECVRARSRGDSQRG
jgi:hypothetical protein